jgi:hypothetical protein
VQVNPTPASPIPMARVLKTWWPLAASWMLMGVELPALSAIVARLPNPEINLAAYGGIVFPLALIIEAPVIMLLAASTALSKDWASYLRIRQYMNGAGALLTLLHILVAFTPLYNVVAEQILGVPAEIVEPGRIGLMVMTPWTWSIAYRRFHQGVMIRFGHSDAIGIGTVVRLLAGATVLTIGFVSGAFPGIVVGAGAAAAGVMAEALYTAWRVRPVLRNELRPAPAVAELSWLAFWRFYIPLALTSFLLLVWQPIGSAALSRMPLALESLAVWPVVSGLIFMIRSPGIAYNEVVVALLDEPQSYPTLNRFTRFLTGTTTAMHFLVAVTPLALWWFTNVAALPEYLITMALVSLWITLPLPALSVLQSWYQGAIMHGRLTRGIPESVLAFLAAILAVLGTGIALGTYTGIYVGMVGFVLANLAQTGWLWFRSRQVLAAVRLRDTIPVESELAVTTL